MNAFPCFQEAEIQVHKRFRCNLKYDAELNMKTCLILVDPEHDSSVTKCLIDRQISKYLRAWSTIQSRALLDKNLLLYLE